MDDISGRGGFCSPLVREVGPTGRIPRYQVLPHREDATIPGSTTLREDATIPSTPSRRILRHHTSTTMTPVWQGSHNA